MQEQHQSAPQTVSETPVAGRPVKRRVLGDSGWIQVTTDRGLKYYVNAISKETTWIAPEAAQVWLERRRTEKLHDKQALKKIQESERKLSEEAQLQNWVDITKSLIESKQIPPIMTYDRAQARLCIEKSFLQCPPERRQEVFELAKKAIISKGGVVHLLEQFKARLATLMAKKIVRQDHTPDSLWETYFREDKWLGLRKDNEVIRLIEESIQKVQEEVSNKLEELMPAFQSFVSRCFELYVKRQAEAAHKSVKALIQDNDFVLEFTTPTSLDEFKTFVQAEDVSEGPDSKEADMLMWGEFLMTLEPELVDELLIDTWQNWCQEQWQKDETADASKRESGHQETAPNGRSSSPESGQQATSQSRRDKDERFGEGDSATNNSGHRVAEAEDGALSESCEDTGTKISEAPRPMRNASRVSRMADRLKKRPLETKKEGDAATAMEKRRKLITAEASLRKRKELLHEMFDSFKDPFRYLDSRWFASRERPARQQLVDIDDTILSHMLRKLEDNDSRWPQLEVDLVSYSHTSPLYKTRARSSEAQLPRHVSLDYHKIRGCYHQWLQSWLGQRKHQLAVLLSNSSSIDLSEMYRAICGDSSFDPVTKRVPRYILEPWLEAAREEMVEDLLGVFENFLRSNPQVSQMLSKKSWDTETAHELIPDIKDVIRNEPIYKRLSIDRRRRDQRIADFLISYRKLREGSHAEAMKLLDQKSAASKAAQDDYEKNKIRLEDSVAEREEDLVLLGAGDEEL